MIVVDGDDGFCVPQMCSKPISFFHESQRPKNNYDFRETSFDRTKFPAERRLFPQNFPGIVVCSRGISNACENFATRL